MGCDRDSEIALSAAPIAGWRPIGTNSKVPEIELRGWGTEPRKLEISENFRFFPVSAEITLDSEKPTKTAWPHVLHPPEGSVCGAISLLTWSCRGDSIR